MQLGWVDFSREDREKVLDVMNLLQEQGAVDEIGIGLVRDAFANLFFPGTSTVQTLPKYFLIVPYVLKEAAEGRYGNDLNNGQFHNSAAGGQNPAGTLWFNSMKAIHSALAVKQFTRPEGIVSVTVCKSTGRKAGPNCTDTYTEIFAKSNIPEECEGHSGVKICKETGKIATEFCPDTEEKFFGALDTEKNATWTPN